MKKACLLLFLAAAAQAESKLPPALHEQAKDLVARALVEEKIGNYPEALTLYTQAMAIAPEEPFIQASLGRLARAIHDRGEDDIARRQNRHVQEAVRRTEVTGFRRDEVSDLCAEGERLLGQGLDLQAADAFYQALAKKDDHPAAEKGLSRTQRRMEARFRNGRFDSPQQYAAYQGMSHFIDEEWEPALAAFEKALKMGPLSDELTQARLPDYAARARVRIDRAGWKTRRAEVMKEALERYKASQWLEAEALFRRILQADPGDEEALRYGQEVFAKAEALRAEEKEKARRKELKDALDEARLLARKGDDMGAVEAAARALDVDAGNEEAGKLLAAAQARLRRQGALAPEITVQDKAEEAYRRALRHYGNDEKAEALEAVDHALKINPRHAEAKELKERLASKEPQP